jgi:hypothetical protein
MEGGLFPVGCSSRSTPPSAAESNLAALDWFPVRWRRSACSRAPVTAEFPGPGDHSDAHLFAMNAELRIRYRPDDWAVGELYAVVKSGAFSGAGSTYFTKQTIKDKFITALRKFPIDGTDLPLLEGGWGDPKVPGTLTQCHLRIAVRPSDVPDKLLVQVDLATHVWGTPDKDQQQAITARFLAEYAAIEVFAAHFKQVLNSERDFAVLSGIAK